MEYEKKLKWTKEYRLKMKVNGKECSKCNTKDVLRKTLCEKCYRNHLYNKKKNDPVWMEKRRKEQRNRYRKKNGIPIDLPLLQAPHGSGTSQYGYRILTKKDHPNSSKSGRILEHVFVMSNHLRRPLTTFENVHHINGIRSDNRIENLELWSTSQPPGQRVEDKINWAKEFLQQYGYTIIDRKQGTIT